MELGQLPLSRRDTEARIGSSQSYLVATAPSIGADEPPSASPRATTTVAQTVDEMDLGCIPVPQIDREEISESLQPHLVSTLSSNLPHATIASRKTGNSSTQLDDVDIVEA